MQSLRGPAPAALPAPPGTVAPLVDVVVPVHNEEAVLAHSIGRLHSYLTRSFPFDWRVTIVDNASSDGTWREATALAERLPGVTAIHLDRKGRGLALRTAWAASNADVVSYMDVDLSTQLDALLPLVAPLVSGHSDVAVGSRLAPGAHVARGPRRELISRAYNALLRTLFAAKVRDAQCGFKAVRSDVAAELLPEVRDNGWFFDTELLLLADHNGLRIHEVPVDWVDDPDSRVDVLRTVAGDLAGMARVALHLLAGRGHVDLFAAERRAPADDFGRKLVTFALIGATSTAVSLAIFVTLTPTTGAPIANVAALGATFAANAWANARYTARRRHVDWAEALGVSAAAAAMSTATLLAARAAGAGPRLEAGLVVPSWLLASVGRLALLDVRPHR